MRLKKGQLCTDHPPNMHRMKSDSLVLVDNLVEKAVAIPRDLGYTLEETIDTTRIGTKGHKLG